VGLDQPQVRNFGSAALDASHHCGVGVVGAPCNTLAGHFHPGEGRFTVNMKSTRQGSGCSAYFFPRMICWCNFCLLVWIGCSSRSCGRLVPGTDPEYKWLCHKGKQDISSPAHSSYTQLNWRQGTPQSQGACPARLVMARHGLVAAWYDGPSSPIGCALARAVGSWRRSCGCVVPKPLVSPMVLQIHHTMDWDTSVCPGLPF